MLIHSHWLGNSAVWLGNTKSGLSVCRAPSLFFVVAMKNQCKQLKAHHSSDCVWLCLKRRSSLPSGFWNGRLLQITSFCFVLHDLVSVNRILLSCVAGETDDAHQILLDDYTYLGTNHTISCSVSWQIGLSCSISLPKPHNVSWDFFCPRNVSRMSLFFWENSLV